MNKNTKRNQELLNKSRRGMLVSQSPARNMKQVVYHNTGDSRTLHEPINDSRPFQPRGKVSCEDNLGKAKEFKIKETLVSKE